MVNERLTRKWIAENEHSCSWKLHKERYTFACSILNGKKVLDIACGTGYGSEMLATQNEVVGVDLDPEAVDEAKKHTPSVSFICSGFETLDLDKRFDAIVSLETIEHLTSPSDFLNFCFANLKTGGQLILSAPTSYTTDLNTFHLTDFTEQSLNQLATKAGFTTSSTVLRQEQPLFEKENTQKLDTKSFFVLLGRYISRPTRIIKRIQDFIKNGTTITYLTAVYEKP